MPFVGGRLPDGLLHVHIVDHLGPADERPVGIFFRALIDERHPTGLTDFPRLARAAVGHEANGPVVGEAGRLHDASIGLAPRPDRDRERHRNFINDSTRCQQEPFDVHGHLPEVAKPYDCDTLGRSPSVTPRRPAACGRARTASAARRRAS